MERAVLILILMVLLLDGRHPQHRPPPRVASTIVTATPLALDDSDPARRELGALRYLEGWSLKADHRDFGGISSMRIDPSGAVIGLSDAGVVITFRPQGTRYPAVLRPLPVLPGEKDAPRSHWDTESMAWDPASGKTWAGFELLNRICRYGKGFLRVEGCVFPAAIRDWPEKTGMESLTLLPGGRFLAIAEDAPGPDGDHDTLLFSGDPVDPATPSPLRFSYRAPQGYLPTDVLAIGHDRLLVMNRRVTLADGFTGVLVLVDIRDLRAGRVLTGSVVARLAAPVQHDNFEALAMSWEKRRGKQIPVLWIASDDNGLFFQRTLLLKFAMPTEWFADRPGGDRRYP
jgi:hypothetical protein